MTIDEAILELRVLHKYYHDRKYFEQRDAIKLGIEALKLTKRVRELGDIPECFTLKGEAK